MKNALAGKIVIASVAKQSIFPATLIKDGLLRCARKDGNNTNAATRRSIWHCHLCIRRSQRLLRFALFCQGRSGFILDRTGQNVNTPDRSNAKTPATYAFSNRQ
jgi:hypothetical protein